MKRRAKLRLAFLIWFIGGFSHLILVLYVNKWFMLTFFMLFIALGFYTMSLKCPSCKKPVLNNPIHIFGVELWLTTPWMPKKCSKCGYDLGK